MALSFKSKERLIIGAFATAAAGWSGVTAMIPVAGPLLADTAGLTVLTTAMAYSLSILHNKNLGIASLAAFSSVAIGAILGQLALKVGASLIPIFGSYFNASVTFVLHAATGWALCEIFNSNRNLDDLSSDEIKELILKNKEKAESERQKYNEAMNSLNPSDKSQVKILIKKLRDKDISETQKSQIISDIEAIFEKNGVDFSLDD